MYKLTACYKTIKPNTIIVYILWANVKAGKKEYDITPFKDLLNELSGGDGSLFILGCTELPVAFEWFDIQNRYIDPTMVLAKNIVLNSEAKLA